MTERFNEKDKIAMIMSVAAIEETCSLKCTPVRNSYQCPNERGCRLLFNRDLGPQVAKELRKSVWSVTDPGLSNRKDSLQRRLKSMVEVGSDEVRQILYNINGQRVCKCFFKV